MEFKDRLENLRREKNLSQPELAEYCGVSPTTYRRWEAGTQEPRVSELKLLAEKLGVSMAVLMGENASDNKVTLHHGAMSLDIPATPEGLAFLEKKLSEFAASEKSPEQSLRAG